MIKYALLGLLREQRDCGYRLRRRFEERLGALWHLNTGQVYQTLRALEKAGLVRESGIEFDPPSDACRPRRVFELTQNGSRVLERWLRRPPARARPVRDETLLRLLLLEPGRHAEALEQIAKLAHLYKQQLTVLLAQKRRLPANATGALLVREVGIESALLHTEAHLRWLEHTKKRLIEADGSLSVERCRE
jgi:DNA-binding PadR family transcriptional regulator